LDYLQEFIKWIGNSDVDNIVAGMQALIVIYEKADDTIFPLSSKLLLSLC
jgi:hypothetical protein